MVKITHVLSVHTCINVNTGSCCHIFITEKITETCQILSVVKNMWCAQWSSQQDEPQGLYSVSHMHIYLQGSIPAKRSRG